MGSMVLWGSYHTVELKQYGSQFINDWTSEKTVMVYANGASQDGVSMTINGTTWSLAPFLSEMSSKVKVQVVGKKDIVADRMYSGTGVLITVWADVTDGDRLYLVPAGILFVWPFVHIGFRVHIMAKDSPNGNPMILESFTESPRTFQTLPPLHLVLFRQYPPDYLYFP